MVKLLAFLRNINLGCMKIGKKTIPFDSSNFVLRGCSLRNTKKIVGLICYTGFLFKFFIYDYLFVDMILK